MTTKLGCFAGASAAWSADSANAAGRSFTRARMRSGRSLRLPYVFPAGLSRVSRSLRIAKLPGCTGRGEKREQGGVIVGTEDSVEYGRRVWKAIIYLMFCFAWANFTRRRDLPEFITARGVLLLIRADDRRGFPILRSLAVAGFPEGRGSSFFHFFQAGGKLLCDIGVLL